MIESLVRIYRRLLPHPVRHFGSLKGKGGIRNYFKRLDSFLRGLDEGSLVLDIGSGNRKLPLKGMTVVSLDIVGYEKLDVVGDAQRLPFKDGVFDAVVLQAMLEHVKEPYDVLAEARRVLKPGGSVWLDVPFIYTVHSAEDYRRWTKKGIEHLAAKFFVIEESGLTGGPGSAASLVARHAAAALFSFGNNVLYHVVFFLAGWCTFWLKYLDGLLGENVYTSRVCTGSYVIGRRP